MVLELVWPLDIPFSRAPVVQFSTMGMSYVRHIPVGMPHLGRYKPLLDTVFFLYRTVGDARQGVRFGGTGFVVGIPTKRWPDRQHGYAVTNWHVAVADGFSVVRLNTLDGGTDEIGFGPEDWHFRPGWHDIAVVPLPTGGHHNIKSLASNFFIPRDQAAAADIGIGDDVFMIGRFVDYMGHQTNKPAVRFGHVSMMDAAIKQRTGFMGNSIVADVHSRTGFSGSPVFVYRTPGSYFLTQEPGAAPKTMLAQHMMYLLGVHWGQFPEEWALKDKPLPTSPEAHGLITDGKYVEGLSGMTCICPSDAIWELLQDAKLAEAREKVEIELERQLGPSTSVPIAESEPPTKPDNPSHKEDFTRLLGAATATRQSGDQT